MKPPLRTSRARGPPSRPEQGSTPAHPFYRFGKHYRVGLQAPERVSIVRMQGSEVSGESVEQTLGDPAAKCVPRDEGYSVAATRKRRPRLARQPVDFKHEGVWLADAQRREAGVPRRRALRHWRRRHLPQYDGLVRGLRVTNCLAQGLPPLSGAALVLRLLPLRPATLPAVSNSVRRWRGHLRGRALKGS
jgi:hypothetical protein